MDSIRLDYVNEDVEISRRNAEEAEEDYRQFCETYHESANEPKLEDIETEKQTVVHEFSDGSLKVTTKWHNTGHEEIMFYKNKQEYKEA